MSLAKRNSVHSLQQLCLKRVCIDIIQHSVRCQAETDKEQSNYLKFQRMFGEVLPRMLCIVSSESCFERSDDVPFWDCINFVFSPLMRTIGIPSCLRFTEEMASAIATNCKDSRCLSLYGQKLSSGWYVQFLKTMTNLVTLNLRGCTFEGVELMSVITDSLKNLKTLSLQETNVDDNALFVLCGHPYPCPNLISTCPFVNSCEITAPLRLQKVSLDQTKNVTNAGIACLLTHMPMLKVLFCPKRLSKVVCEINQRRKASGMSSLQFQLPYLFDAINDTQVLEECLTACPKLVSLCVELSENQPRMDEVIAKTELKRLSAVLVECTKADQVFSGNMKQFWERKGQQISALFISGRAPGGVDGLDVVKNIVTLCPNLTYLSCKRFLVPAKDFFFTDLPKLKYLRILNIELHGDIHLINKVACNFLHFTPNICNLMLHFTIEDSVLIPCLSKEILPSLTNLRVHRDRVTDNFLSLMVKKNYTVSFF